MASDVARVVAEVKKALAANDLTALFESVLVWDDGLSTSAVKVGTASAKYVASKSRVPVWLITAETEAEVDALDKRLRKESFERLLVWQRPQGRTWLFPEKTSSGVRRSKTTEINLEAIAQRLAELRFEPGGPTPTVLDVKERLQRTFSVEKVTEKFYKEFKDIHDRLGGRRADKKPNPLLKGLPDINASRWYASVLLNRLMFLYFLQRKGFLDNDMDYLQNRMREVQKLYGKGKFYTFYTSFLLPLFQEAIGSPRWDSLSPELKNLVGRVPYLNGGVFAHHQLEKEHTIELDDDIFTDIFEIFRRYRWHLDESEHAEDQSLPQINPDILGHIFERYVNEGDEETGAFYTPADVTRWMTTRTVGSTVLQRLIDLEVDLGALIAKDPERYLPSEHFVGRADADEWLGEYPKLGSKEAAVWSKPVPAGRGLPTETVWEVRDRLKYAAQMTKELGTGKFKTPAELFRFNLNNPVLISDAMRTLAPDKLQKYWDELFSITVVDPTCGSGAFLLAALAFLEELALDAIIRAEELTAATNIKTPAFAREHKTRNLGQRRLEIRTRFIIRSLYGADLSGEAVEIARLRLYLAIVATTNEYDDLKPLPDLEFNLAEGNLLVGVNSESELPQLIGSALWAQIELPVVHARLNEVSEAITAFNEAQQTNDHVQREEKKIIARQRAMALKEQLNIALHKAMAPESQYDQWLKSHEPLHYLAQFPGVMLSGGFDVVIGNPPYISRRKISGYKFGPYPCSNAPDIYAPCAYRAQNLMNDRATYAMVMPLSLSFGSEYGELREHLLGTDRQFACASFGDVPDALFRGVHLRITINFLTPSKKSEILVTGLNRWTQASRPALLSLLRLLPVNFSHADRLVKVDGNFMADLLAEMQNHSLSFLPEGSNLLMAKGVAGYWFPATMRPLRNLDFQLREVESATRMVSWGFADPLDRDAVFSLLVSRLGYLLFQTVSDVFHVSPWNLEAMPVRLKNLRKFWASSAKSAKRLNEFLEKNPESHTWRNMKGMWSEGLDTRTAHHLSDAVVQDLLSDLGMEGRWPEFEAAYWRSMKVTGEAGHTKRGLLPPKVD
jgi:type I restriction-modification system DNA methylase subunit